MEIIFGQHFDQGYFLDYSLPLNETVFNQMITGPLGLLNLLERELSLTGTYLSNVQRKINYQKILKEYVQHNPSAFFSKTFDNDPGGVAGELLKYRDQLILSGWNKEFNDVSDKIDCLRAIERFKQIEPGIEDRWRQIYESIDSANIPGMQLKRIVLEDELELMHPFFGQLFDLLRNKGLTIGSTKKDPFIASQNNLGKIKEFVAGITNECDLKTREAESFQIIRFRNDQEASEFFASQTKLLKGAVIINSDNNTFDDFQQLFNRPASGSEFQNANPQSIQLFKLALALFIKPLNIENILSYLQVPVHPIPLKLRMQLMKIIAQEGGVENEKWKEAIGYSEFH